MTTLLIDNCTAADFEYVCPKKWSELRPSYVEGVRHCHQCNRMVYLCRSDADIKLYDSLNYCIAIAQPVYVARHEAKTSPQAEPSPVAPEPEYRVPFVGVRRKSK